MASTNFKLFDENKANMMSDTEYNINTQRLNGVQAGIASSKLQNKTLHQTSLVAYSLAQIMMQNGYDANDSVAVSAFVGNMSNSLLQKVLDKATSVEAQNGVNNTKWMTPALTKAAIDILAAKSSNILSNETKTLYGLGTNAVPDDVLALLGNYLKNDAVKIEKGSYTGAGTNGANHPNSLAFQFPPKFLAVFPINGLYQLFLIRGMEGSNTSPNGHSYGNVAVAWDGSTVSWHTTDSGAGTDYQLNRLDTQYFYIAIG